MVDAFNDGYRSLRTSDWEFIVKLDGDLSFNSEYFESCFRVFAREEKLGIAGGTIYNVINGEAIPEVCPAFHVRGATRSTAARAGTPSAASGPRPGGIRWTKLRRRCLDGGRERCLNCRSFTIGRQARMTRDLGRRVQERQGELHLRLSSALYVIEMCQASEREAVSDSVRLAVLGIHFGILAAGATSR